MPTMLLRECDCILVSQVYLPFLWGGAPQEIPISFINLSANLSKK